jgi:hypothetical protein
MLEPHRGVGVAMLDSHEVGISQGPHKSNNVSGRQRHVVPSSASDFRIAAQSWQLGLTNVGTSEVNVTLAPMFRLRSLNALVR